MECQLALVPDEGVANASDRPTAAINPSTATFTGTPMSRSISLSRRYCCSESIDEVLTIRKNRLMLLRANI